MAKHKIEFTDDAKVDFSFFTAFERKIMLDNIKRQLTYEPLVETKNRKNLGDNPISPWELRIGKYRVFYEVIENRVTVSVVAVGSKQHNILYIRGEEVRL